MQNFCLSPVEYVGQWLHLPCPEENGQWCLYVVRYLLAPSMLSLCAGLQRATAVLCSVTHLGCNLTLWANLSPHVVVELNHFYSSLGPLPTAETQGFSLKVRALKGWFNPWNINEDTDLPWSSSEIHYTWSNIQALKVLFLLLFNLYRSDCSVNLIRRICPPEAPVLSQECLFYLITITF